MTWFIYGVPRGSKAPIRVDPYFKNTGRPVRIRVDPYLKYGSTRIFAGRPVNIRVDPYFNGSTRIIRVDPYICGSTRIFTGRPVFYRSTCIYGSTRNKRVHPFLRVDPYLIYGSTRKNTGRPVFQKYGSTRKIPYFYGSTRIFEIRVDPYRCF